MRWLLEIGIFVVSIMAGLLLGGLVPEGLPPKFWRLPMGVFLVGVGIILAVIAFS
jgi:hypothetical protein